MTGQQKDRCGGKCTSVAITNPLPRNLVISTPGSRRAVISVTRQQQTRCRLSAFKRKTRPFTGVNRMCLQQASGTCSY